MRNALTEFRVGLFVLIGSALAVFGYFWTFDGVARGEAAYVLEMGVPNADGLWPGSPVKLAGVDIGSVDTLDVVDNEAELKLKIRAAYPLPDDSHAELRATGFLGDRYVAMVPGKSETALKSGARVPLIVPGGDLESLQRDASVITDDLKVVTAMLREFAENKENKESIEATLASVRALSEDLRLLAHRNVDDIDAIVASVGRLTAHLERITETTGGGLERELDKVGEATDTLQKALDDLSSVTGKLDAGEGTLGALINERETIDLVNDTIGEVNTIVRSFSSLRAQVYYDGRVYLGTQPRDPAFVYGNPLSGGMANTLGIRLRPSEDFWWLFELTSHPHGTITWEDTWFPDEGPIRREYVRQPGYRFSAMLEKRWFDFSLRLGIKESAGGVGASVWFFDDKLRLAVDVFDFEFGSYPVLAARGIPNSRVGLRYEPWRGVHIEAGAEQVILGARYGYFTGYLGVGFSFFDDGVKLLMATVPTP